MGKYMIPARICNFPKKLRRQQQAFPADPRVFPRFGSPRPGERVGRLVMDGIQSRKRRLPSPRTTFHLWKSLLFPKPVGNFFPHRMYAAPMRAVPDLSGRHRINSDHHRSHPGGSRRAALILDPGTARKGKPHTNIGRRIQAKIWFPFQGETW